MSPTLKANVWGLLGAVLALTALGLLFVITYLFTAYKAVMLVITFITAFGGFGWFMGVMTYVGQHKDEFKKTPVDYHAMRQAALQRGGR